MSKKFKEMMPSLIAVLIALIIGGIIMISQQDRRFVYEQIFQFLYRSIHLRSRAPVASVEYQKDR